jgi:hypothetical protein
MSAVEWQHIELSKFLHGKSEFTDAHDILIKAKEMEKEQKINDFKHAQVLHAIGDEIRAEQWYEQTYGGNK